MLGPRWLYFRVLVFSLSLHRMKCIFQRYNSGLFSTLRFVPCSARVTVRSQAKRRKVVCTFFPPFLIVAASAKVDMCVTASSRTPHLILVVVVVVLCWKKKTAFVADLTVATSVVKKMYINLFPQRCSFSTVDVQLLCRTLVCSLSRYVLQLPMSFCICRHLVCMHIETCTAIF